MAAALPARAAQRSGSLTASPPIATMSTEASWRERASTPGMSGFCLTTGNDCPTGMPSGGSIAETVPQSSVLTGSVVTETAASTKVPGDGRGYTYGSSSSSSSGAPTDSNTSEQEMSPFLKLVAAFLALKIFDSIWKPTFNFIWNSVGSYLLNPLLRLLHECVFQSYMLSVTKVQVAVVDPQRKVHQALQKAAIKAYTSGHKGAPALLQETTKLLLKDLSFVVCGHMESSSMITRSAAESCLKGMCAEERARFEGKRQSPLKRSVEASTVHEPGYYGRLGQEQLTVVTLLVTAQGLKQAPQVVTFSNVLTLLEVLQSLPNESIKACQVLWTPDEEYNTYSTADLALGYPQLKSFKCS